MNDCDRTTDRLAAYVDDVLSPAERAEIERHLDRCERCRVAASAEHGARQVLRARADQLREPLPPGLRTRCAALVRQHSSGPAPARWWTRAVPVAVTALLLVFVGTAVLSLATQRSDAVLAAQLTADHSKCFRGVARDAPARDAQALRAAFAADGLHVHFPSSAEGEGVRLVDARRCFYADGRMPHVLYRVNGHDVSLFMLDGVTRKNADVTAFGHRARIWTRGGSTFVLVSASTAGDLPRAVAYVMREAR